MPAEVVTAYHLDGIELADRLAACATHTVILPLPFLDFLILPFADDFEDTGGTDHRTEDASITQGFVGLHLAGTEVRSFLVRCEIPLSKGFCCHCQFPLIHGPFFTTLEPGGLVGLPVNEITLSITDLVADGDGFN